MQQDIFRKTGFRKDEETAGMPIESGRKNSIPVPGLDEIDSYVLAHERKIYLEEDVGSSILHIQRMILRWGIEDKGKPVKDRKPIGLYIFSYGGDVDYMWSLIDTIEVSVTPVYTYNMGIAASAAVLIYLAGHKRFMMKRSKLILHEGSAQMTGNATKVLDASDAYRKTIRNIRNYVLERTAIPARTLGRLKNHEWELDAQYCLEHDVCDRIVNSLENIL